MTRCKVVSQHPHPAHLLLVFLVSHRARGRSEAAFTALHPRRRGRRVLAGRDGAHLEGRELQDEEREPDVERRADPVRGGEESGLAGRAAEEEARSRYSRRETSPGADAADAPAQTCKHVLWKTVRLQLN